MKLSPNKIDTKLVSSFVDSTTRFNSCVYFYCYDPPIKSKSQDGRPRPSGWRIRRLHDDAGDLCVLFNNQMEGSSGHRLLFYCTYNRHHWHRPTICRKEMEIKEGPTGHLPEHLHRPLTNIWEIHWSSIPFRRNDKHKHGKERIQKRQTICHPWTPQETVWYAKPIRARPGSPLPPRTNGLQPTGRVDARHHWEGPNVPYSASIWRSWTNWSKSDQLRDD